MILANERFDEALRHAALALLDMNDKAPRIVRYTSDIRRWLLTQAMLAFYFARLTDPTRPSLTASSLISYVCETNVASRNTTAAHVSELRAYRLIVDGEPEGDRRARPLVASDSAQALIRQWFDSHLASLDRLDGGKRSILSLEEPELLWHAQPRMSDRLFADPRWSRPPASVACFVKTGSGSNILHAMISKLPPGPPQDGRFFLGQQRIADYAKRFIISRSHAQRLFARARDLDICGWEGAGDGAFWISEGLVADYRHWQAVKFAAIDEAFHRARNRVAVPA